MKNRKNHKKEKPSFKGKNQKDPRRQNNKPSHNRSGKKQTETKIKVDLFGIHAVREAWLNPKRHIHDLFITDSTLDQFDDALTKAHDMGLKRPVPKIVDRSVLDHSTPPGSVHQGVGLNCQNLEEVDIHDIIRSDEHKAKSVLIMLDQVTDPHNVGAIIRSASAFGAHGLIMQSKHAPDIKGVLAKTACGGVEHLPVAYETNLTRSLEALQAAGYFAIGLDERGEKALGELPHYPKTVLVLGAEGDGLRRLVREQCDVLTCLPTQEPIASLNVSNAAAVGLYALSLPNQN
ncbi:MAG: 23S rRNA (guanosine(2251)-2'-O)-methyltransferase RlmB [Pseudomonadota bacterium]